MADWWLDFFDDGYRFLYGDMLTPERTETEVAQLVALLGLPEGARLLDLCCGDARHAVPLERRGYRVTGVDIARRMLARGAERCRRVLPDEHPWPALVEADARRLPLKPVFDAVVSLFNSIGYGTDQDTLAMLGAAHGALRPRGQLVVECSNRDQLVRETRPGGEVGTADVGGLKVTHEAWVEPVAGIQHALMSWTQDGRRREKHLRHRMYTATELKALLHEAGFPLVEIYGGYDRRRLQVDSLQLVAHARA